MFERLFSNMALVLLRGLCICLMILDVVVVSSGDREKRDTDWTVEDVPNPVRNVLECGRHGKQSWVCDPDQLLKDGEADRIDQAIVDLRLRTGSEKCHCPVETEDCQEDTYDLDLYKDPRNQYRNMSVQTTFPWSGGTGWKVGVLVVRSVAVYASYDDDDDDEETRVRSFARRVRERWDFGHCDDDLLLLMAVDQGHIQSSIGDHLDDKLSRSCALTANQESDHYLQSGDYGGGLWSILDVYRDIITGHKSCTNIPLSVAYFMGCIGLGIAMVYIVGRHVVIRHRMCSQKRWLQRLFCFHAPFRSVRQSEVEEAAHKEDSDDVL